MSMFADVIACCRWAAKEPGRKLQFYRPEGGGRFFHVGFSQGDLYWGTWPGIDEAEAFKRAAQWVNEEIVFDEARLSRKDRILARIKLAPAWGTNWPAVAAASYEEPTP